MRNFATEVANFNVCLCSDIKNRCNRCTNPKYRKTKCTQFSKPQYGDITDYKIPNLGCTVRCMLRRRASESRAVCCRTLRRIPRNPSSNLSITALFKIRQFARQEGILIIRGGKSKPLVSHQSTAIVYQVVCSTRFPFGTW